MSTVGAQPVHALGITLLQSSIMLCRGPQAAMNPASHVLEIKTNFVILFRIFHFPLMLGQGMVATSMGLEKSLKSSHFSSFNVGMESAGKPLPHARRMAQLGVRWGFKWCNTGRMGMRAMLQGDFGEHSEMPYKGTVKRNIKFS